MAASVCNGQNKIFRHFDTADGLSQNTVNSILQDRQGYMWFATKDGLNRFDGIRFKIFRMTDYGLASNFINTIYEDTDGKIWIGTEHGLCLYIPQTESIKPLQCVGDTLLSQDVNIRHIAAGEGEKVCIATVQCGLLRYDSNQNKLERDKGIYNNTISFCSYLNNTEWVAAAGDNLYFKTGKDAYEPFVAGNGEMPFRYIEITDMVTIRGAMYVGTDHGLFKINLRTLDSQEILSGFFRTLCVSDDGMQIWAGTQDGIYIVSVNEDKVVEHITQPKLDDAYSLSDNAIYSIYLDHEGSIWIGSYFGGINYLPAYPAVFEIIYPNESRPFMGRRIREMCQDHNGTIWMGTEDKGLLRYDPATGNITSYPTHLHTNNIHGLCVDGNMLFVGSFDGGLERINISDGTYKTYFASNTPGALTSDYVFSIMRDTNRNIWIGTTNGLMLYDHTTEQFVSVPDGPEGFVYHISESKDGKLWVATYNNGLFEYDYAGRKSKHYQYQNRQQGTIADSKVISICCDSKDRVWVMTHDGGLSLLNKTDDTFSPIHLDDKNQQILVMRMVEDTSGTLWCSTNNGLINYNPDTNEKQLYTANNGLHTNHFNYQSGIIDRDGYLYFGTINGFIRFRPDKFNKKQLTASIALTELLVDNKEVVPGADNSPLKQSINYTSLLVIDSSHKSFAISAQVLSYVVPETGYIKYKLEGIDKDWQTLTDRYAYISYANLPYGNYTLQITCDTKDGLSIQPRTLDIYIKPPLYLSTIAKILYTILAVSAVALIVWYSKLLERRRIQYAEEKLEQEKQHELYESKISFFTNIAHEIRTPLTLIKSPLENILSNGNLPSSLKEDLTVMNMNTGQLIALVNQLLDFRKSEQDGIHLNKERIDITSAMNTIIKVFNPVIKQQNINLITDIPDNVYAHVDRDVFGKILSNIMSNALKYANNNILVSLHSNHDTITITEANDGDIVPLAMREEIFKPFVRYNQDTDNKSNTGTGIGLALIRKLVTLHGGTIGMDDDTSINRFILTIPISSQNTEHTEGTENDASALVVTHTDSDLPAEQTKQTLLIVEDNIQLIDFLKRHFSQTYNTYTATDGQKALEVLEAKERIDLVVSDIMMPNMDGMELCNYIKENVNYSHIPVVLLTAKTTEQSRLEGLRHGADAYIDKPFSMPVLEQTIQMLIENRQRLYNSVMQRPYAVITSVVGSEVENEFINKLGKEILDHLDDSEYDVDQLAEAMNMSRSSLNRKIKATLDMTPNDYIRIERLKKAVELLKTRRYKVNEVCYMVGFNTPSYFTKCFHQQYGKLPSEI